MKPGTYTPPESGGRVLGEINGEGLRCTHLHFPKGAQLPPHRHAGACLSIIYSGGFEEQHAGRSIFARRGTVLLKPPEELHADRLAPSGSKQYGIEFSCEDAEWQLVQSLGVIETEAAIFPRVIDVLARELERPDDLSAWALKAAAMEAVIVLSRTRTAAPHVAPAWFKKILAAIDDRVPERITVNDLAEFASVHPVYLCRVFRKQLGCNASDYLRRKRLEWAADRLLQGEAIASVSAATGFCDDSHFIRAFRQQFGVTPRGYCDGQAQYRSTHKRCRPR